MVPMVRIKILSHSIIFKQRAIFKTVAAMAVRCVSYANVHDGATLHAVHAR